jgi:hypothetical protein
MFPYAYHRPAIFFETAICVSIPANVGLDFFTPPIRIILGPGSVFGATMPKTAIEEDGNSVRR